jgi:hypothetical protein
VSSRKARHRRRHQRTAGRPMATPQDEAQEEGVAAAPTEVAVGAEDIEVEEEPVVQERKSHKPFLETPMA